MCPLIAFKLVLIHPFFLCSCLGASVGGKAASFNASNVLLTGTAYKVYLNIAFWDVL